MAIEIPNCFEACALVVPVLPGLSGLVTDSHIPSSNGFLPADAGGFSRSGAGAYVLGLVDAINPFEGVAMIQVIDTSANASANVGSNAFIIPRDPANPVSPPDGKHIGVGLFDKDGAAIDANFYCSVFRFASGPQLIP
jgi:hypothetical protein